LDAFTATHPRSRWPSLIFFSLGLSCATDISLRDVPRGVSRRDGRRPHHFSEVAPRASQRRIGVRLCLAIIASLPGILLFQFIAGIPIGLLLATVLASYEVFGSSDTIRWIIGLPTILLIFVAFTAASVAGCYTGASVGWLVGGGTPVRMALSQQKIPRWIFTRLRSRKA
jgi:hypothetical protein